MTMDCEECDYRTKLTCSGTGLIKDILKHTTVPGQVDKTSLRVSFVRRRQDGSQTIKEEDLVTVVFWSSAAQIINDLASVDQHIYLDMEIRSSKEGLVFKAKSFEILD